MGSVGKIALEEHFITEELVPYAAGNRPTRDDAVFVELRRRLADFCESRLAGMDEAGIEFAVLSATVPGVQAEPEPERSVGLARRTNDRLAEEVRRRPDRYGGFAALPLQDPVAAAAELERAVTQLGLAGAMVNGHTLGHYLDETRFDPFWEAAESLGAPIYLHPTDPVGQPAMFAGRPELNGAVWSWTVEGATHALRLIFGGTLRRFPRLRLILGHMGETLPAVLWRIDNRARAVAGRDLDREETPSWLFRRNFWITTTGVCDPAALMTAIANVGEDRVMFSVDYPYESGRVATAFVEAAPLSEAVRRKVCRENAAALLGPKGPLWSPGRDEAREGA